MQSAIKYCKISEILALSLFFVFFAFNVIQLRCLNVFFIDSRSFSRIDTHISTFPFLSFVLHHVPAGCAIRIPCHSIAIMLYYCQKSKHYTVYFGILEYNFITYYIFNTKCQFDMFVLCASLQLQTSQTYLYYYCCRSCLKSQYEILE